MDLYVYYDVVDASVDELRSRLARLRAELPTRRSRLMKRADGSGTWMEVYEDVDAAFEAILEAAVARLDIAALTGPRHAERFVELD